MAAEVDAYLHQRASAAASSVGSNLNYLNPHYSSAKSVRQWGNDVVKQANRAGMVFGSGKAVHYHGTAKGMMSWRPHEFRVLLPTSFRLGQR